MIPAHLYGVGVGPGDPELMTLKAARVLHEAAVIAYVTAGKRPSRARGIAARHIDEDKTEIALCLPMSVDPETAHPAYAEGADQIVEQLDQGRDVAVLCEGDPLLYGSFARLLIYLEERIAGRHWIEIVPGVSSVCAAVASAGHALVRRSEPLTIVPAPLPCAAMDERLARGDAIVIMKVGRHLARVRDALTRSGRLVGAVYVESVGTEGERVLPASELIGEGAPYFSLILVPPVRQGAEVA